MENFVLQLLNFFERTLVSRFDSHLAGRLVVALHEPFLEVLLFKLDLNSAVLAVLDFLFNELDLAVAIFNLLL